MIRETVPALAMNKSRWKSWARPLGREVVTFSSMHRLSEALPQRVHAMEVERSGGKGQV
jgi:hypothetical protein